MFLRFVQEQMLVVEVENRADSKAVRDYLEEKIPWEDQTVRENGGTLGPNELAPDR